MPLFPPPDPTIETCSSGFAGAAATNIAQTLFLSAVTTHNYPMIITFMECFLSAVNASNPTIELGMYAWNTSGNGALLSSGTVVPTSAGWWQVTLATPISLSARTRYYMAYLNRNSGDSTTFIGTAGGNTASVLACATLAGQTVMPANLSSLVTTNGSRMVLRGWT